MKFTPPVSLPENLLQGIGSTRVTWEYRWATCAVWVQLIIGGIVLAWYWRNLPPQVPLWYSRPWGNERLASPWSLLLPLLSSVIVYSINLAAIVRFTGDHPVFTRVLLLTSVLISVLSGIIVVRIITLIH